MAKTIQYARPKLYPKQEAAVFDDARISVVEAGTKCGKTIGCLAWLFEQAAVDGRIGRNYWWVAPVFGQAEIGFRRMQMAVPRALYKPNKSKMTITLINGAVIWFKSAERPDDLYGEDVYGVVMDEASRMRREAWEAIRSTLTFTRGAVRMIGNVKGRKNFFWELARAAEAGTPDMAYHRMTAWDAVDAGVLDREEIESSLRDFKRLGREGAWKQLYLAEAADDGDNPFGLAAIEACVVGGLSTDWPKAAGVDLAGRGAANFNAVENEAADRDYTAIVMLDKDGFPTHESRFRKPHAETATEIERIVGRTMALVDSTGAGDQTVENLQRRGTMRVEGFVFNERSRQDLLEGLALAIGEESVHFTDGFVRAELDQFEFRYTRGGVRYVVPEGQHDDGAFALALALKRLPRRRGRVAAPSGSAKSSTWTGGADARAAQSLLGGPQQGADPDAAAPKEVATPRVPFPMVVGGRGRVPSRWSGGG